jgi:NAD dependent epimerase/dehydratase family enzyme
LLKVPAFAMRLLIGKAADELLLCSQKMKSHRLEETGFVFKHPTLTESVGYVLN